MPFEVGSAGRRSSPDGPGMPPARSKTLGQVDAAFDGLRVPAIEERRVSDRSDAQAATFVGDLRAERCSFIALGPEESEFYQFVGAKLFLELGKKRWCQSAFAQLKRRLQLLAQSAEIRFLRAGEREFVHVSDGLHG